MPARLLAMATSTEADDVGAGEVAGIPSSLSEAQVMALLASERLVVPAPLAGRVRKDAISLKAAATRLRRQLTSPFVAGL